MNVGRLSKSTFIIIFYNYVQCSKALKFNAHAHPQNNVHSGFHLGPIFMLINCISSPRLIIVILGLYLVTLDP